MRRTSILLAPLATLALLVVACSPDEPSGDPPADGLPGEAAEMAYAECMRDNGVVDWPDPVFVDGEWEIRVPEGIDLDSSVFIDAETECARIRREAQPGGAGEDPADREMLEAEMARMLEFAACMRDQGLDYPDPQFDDEGGGIEVPAGPVDGDQEAFDAAREICEGQSGEPAP